MKKMHASLKRIIITAGIFVAAGTLGVTIWFLVGINGGGGEISQLQASSAVGPGATPIVEPTAMPSIDQDLVDKILGRPITVTAEISENSADEAKQVIEKAIEALRGDPDLYDEWIQLGLYRKFIGDIKGARMAWEFAAAIRPFASVPFNNLGDLYAYELKDNERAENYYLKAIENEPSGIQWYVKASEFYRYFLKDISRAKDVLRKGIIANPGQASVLSEILSSF